MKHIIADHSCNAFLKPGKIIISRNPILVSTVLGSCVAVTMYSPKMGVGAICHAMLPNNPKQDKSLLYVEAAVRFLYRKMEEYGVKGDMVIKLFGGAQVLDGSDYGEGRRTVGEQNIMQAKKILDDLGLSIESADIGGKHGRKLFFSIKTGKVYMHKLKFRGNIVSRGDRT